MKIKSKISILLGLIIIFSIPTIQSCKKYPEGPSISLRSRTARVSNTWRIENYRVNGNDFTSFISGYTETFTKDGGYYYSWGNFEGSGRWFFQNNDREIRVEGISHKSSETLYILKLEENEFWYYYMDGNDRNEFHLVSN